MAWYVWTRAHPPGPGGAHVPSPLEPGSLVVMPVSVQEPTPESAWLRQGLAEMIRSQLGQTPGIRIVARHRLAAALKQAGYDEDTGPSPEAAATVARKLRAERLVTGSFVRVEDRFVVSAQVVHVASGRTEATASVRGRSSGELLDAVDELCLKLEEHREELGAAGYWQAANYLARASARLHLPAPEPARLEGDDTTYFVQTARLHAVHGKRELALRELAQGLALGFGEYRHIQDDPDFEPLQKETEFRRLVAEPALP